MDEADNMELQLLAHKHVRDRQFVEALAIYDTVLSFTPLKPHVWINRGVALQGLYRLDEAIESYEKAMDVYDGPGPYVAGHINRGVVRNWLGDYNGAVSDYDIAIDLEPNSEPARLGRSTVFSAMGEFDEALADTEHVLALNPGNGGAHYNRSLILLSQGNYEEGFREHEWRFGTKSVLGPYRYPHPVWAGEKTDKTILVYCEQGLGDCIQFMRYLPRLFGLNVIIQAPKALARLFQQFNFPVYERDAPLPEFDLQCPIMSFGAIFGTKVDNVPCTHAYLKPDRDAARTFRDMLKPQAVGLPAVGFAWSSGVRFEQPIARAMQKRKSIPTALMQPLMMLGIKAVDLQKDQPEDGRPLGIINLMPYCGDLADTSGLIANLDLVITVDSAVAHLAGAMGKPVWVLNRYDICWRWLSGSKPSPWYESARIYRQSAPNRWDDVIADVKKDLTQWVNQRQRLSTLA